MTRELMLDPAELRAVGTTTITSALRGTLRSDARSRPEFFALAGATN